MKFAWKGSQVYYIPFHWGQSNFLFKIKETSDCQKENFQSAKEWELESGKDVFFVGRNCEKRSMVDLCVSWTLSGNFSVMSFAGNFHLEMNFPSQKL